MNDGDDLAVAVRMFTCGELSAARAAKLARMLVPQFLAHLSAQGIAVVNYEPTELVQELADFDVASCSLSSCGLGSGRHKSQ
jgi:predicted HTH domain antitoxin